MPPRQAQLRHSRQESRDGIVAGATVLLGDRCLMVVSIGEVLVGPVVADHSWPVSLARGVLVVGVDEPIWHTQLTYLQADILERLGSIAGAAAVTRVEVRVRAR